MMQLVSTNDFRNISCMKQLTYVDGQERDGSLFKEGDDINHVRMCIWRENWDPEEMKISNS